MSLPEKKLLSLEERLDLLENVIKLNTERLKNLENMIKKQPLDKLVNK